MSKNAKPPCRVLMLLENSHYPLDPRVVLEAGTLVRAGYRVTVIAPASRGQPWRETLGGVLVYRFPIHRSAGGKLGYVWEYGSSLVAAFLLSLWVFVRHGFDVVHAHNPPDLFVMIAAIYKILGKRFVFDHHDLAPEMYAARFRGASAGLAYRALLRFERLSCRLADHVIATNQSYKAVEMTRGKVREDHITIVRNGPNLGRMRAVAPDPGLRRRASTLIGYVGVMGSQDGIDYLLRALDHLARDLDRDDFYCVLVGSGHELRGAEALSRRLGLDERVRFTGFVSDADLVRYLSTCDICVSPEPSNPFTDRSTMIKLMEYMALEKPIVAFDLPEHRFTAQEAALYARPNDELDFARQIATLMDAPKRRREMGRAGRQRVEAELAWCHQEQHLLQAYRKVGAGPPRITIPGSSPRYERVGT